jgi:hypothetical protein
MPFGIGCRHTACPLMAKVLNCVHLVTVQRPDAHLLGGSLCSESGLQHL